MKPCSKNIHKTVTHDTESLHTRWEKHIHASSIVNSHAKQNRPLFNVYLTLRTNYLKTHVIVTEINTGEDWLLSLTIGSTGHISAMYEGLAYLTGCVRVWCRCTVAKHLNGWSWFLLCASPQQTATLLLHRGPYPPTQRKTSPQRGWWTFVYYYAMVSHPHQQQISCLILWIV